MWPLELKLHSLTSYSAKSDIIVGSLQCNIRGRVLPRGDRRRLSSGGCGNELRLLYGWRRHRHWKVRLSNWTQVFKSPSFTHCMHTYTPVWIHRAVVSLCVACSYGGGFGKNTTWAEYAKKQVDHLNGHFIRKDGFPSQQTLNTLSVGFYDQVSTLRSSLTCQFYPL